MRTGMRNVRVTPSGVGTGMGVGVMVGVAVAVAVTVGVHVCVGVYVWVGVLVCVGVGVGVGVAVRIAVGVADDVAVSVGVGAKMVGDGEGPAAGGITALGCNARSARNPQRQSRAPATMAYATRCRIDSETHKVAT